MKALARYQIILLGEQKHIDVNNLPPRTMPRPGIKPTICRSRVRRPNHYTTDKSVAIAKNADRTAYDIYGIAAETNQRLDVVAG